MLKSLTLQSTAQLVILQQHNGLPMKVIVSFWKDTLCRRELNARTCRKNGLSNNANCGLLRLIDDLGSKDDISIVCFSCNMQCPKIQLGNFR